MSESLLSRACLYAVALSLAVCFAACVVSLGAPALARAEACTNAVFRTGPSTHLPDCRAYELVTPSYKDDGQMGVIGISPDGSSFVLSALAGFSGLEASPGAGNFYATKRTGVGWSTVGTEPPASEYTALSLHGFAGDHVGDARDAATMAFEDRGPGRPENSIDFYKREAGGAIVDVGPAFPPTAPSGLEIQELDAKFGLFPVGLSPDGSDLLFSLAKGERWPFDHTVRGGETTETPSLYEYVGVGNTTPLLVGVNDEGAQISECGTIPGGPSYSHNAISSDGGTVFFTALHTYREKAGAPEIPCSPAGTPQGPEADELFARIDNGRPGAHTVAISEPSKEDCAACETFESRQDRRSAAEFLGASQDGSKVFFSTSQPLLGGDASNNIYEYDFSAPAGQRVVRVSGGDATVSGPTANEFGHPQISEDGSHVYFFAKGVLTEVPNDFGQSAQPGANNLYVFERDARYPAGRTVFVATLSADPVADPLVGLWRALTPTGADVTPDGRFLLFTSHTDLTPDDTSTAQQVFRYDADPTSVEEEAKVPQLVRVSVGQAGFNDNGNTSVGDAEIVSPASGFEDRVFEEEYKPDAYGKSLSISANGEYVFFQSPDGLTPEAFDKKAIGIVRGGLHDGQPLLAMNVYEYHDGVVSLISDGRDITSEGESSDVRLVGTDESGGDVFFKSSDQLVAQDTDDNTDIYDARVGGGFPATSAPAGCVGEACQGQLSSAPTLLSPGSEFQAGANPPLAGPVLTVASKAKVKAKPKRCKKGTSLRRGKCVKRKAKKSARGRK